jgi:cytochrome c556
MRRTTIIGLAALAVAAAALEAAAAAPSSVAPPTEDQAKAAQTFMKDAMEPAAEAVWGSVGYIINADGARDLSPKTDEEWNAVLDNIDVAELFVESVKEADFKWDPESWSGYADGVIAALEANRAAAAAHDVDAMFVAGEALDQACESCHLHFEEGEAAGGASFQ